MKVLMVLTSHDQLGNTGARLVSGSRNWRRLLCLQGCRRPDRPRIAQGGRPLLDPKSNEPNFQTDLTRRFEKDADVTAQLDRTVRLDSVKQEDYDTVSNPCGHGPMLDLAEDKNSIKLVESFLAAGKTFTWFATLPAPRAM